VEEETKTMMLLTQTVITKTAMFALTVDGENFIYLTQDEAQRLKNQIDAYLSVR